MKRMGEDPDKPLREADAGMEIDESELRTYNDGNPKESFEYNHSFFTQFFTRKCKKKSVLKINKSPSQQQKRRELVIVTIVIGVRGNQDRDKLPNKMRLG